MAMPLDLVLVRHGESVGNEAIRKAKAGEAVASAQDQHSSRRWMLTDTGRKQAEAAGAWLREQKLDVYDRHYCSPYVRAMQTAALLRLSDAEWWVEPLVRERDRGYEYVAQTQEVAAQFAHSARTRRDDRFLWRPAGGESITDVDLRLRQVLATLARELDGRRVICVTHEDAMDAMRFRLEKMTIEHFTKLAENERDRIGNGWVLHYTRRNPDKPSAVEDKFGWVRLVDPEGAGGFEWRAIERVRFSNEELIDMAEREGTQFARR